MARVSTPLTYVSLFASLLVAAPGCGDSDDQTTAADGGSTSTTASTTTEGETGGTTSTGPGVCGNSIVDGDEICDDGNDIEGDACSTDCMTAGPARWFIPYDPTDVVSRAADVAVDGAGNVFAIGSVLVAGSGEDIWIHRYAPDGTIVFAVVSDAGGGKDVPVGIVELTDTAFVVASVTDSTTFRIDRLTPDGAGLENWVDPTMVAEGASADPSGNITVTGSATNSAAAIVTRSYAANGNLRWQVQVPEDAAGSQNGTAVATDSAGNVYIGATKGVAAMGNWTYVAKYDQSGNEQWVHDTDHADAVPGAITAVAIGPGDSVFVLSEHADGDAQMADKVIQYDPAGTKVWEATVDNYTIGLAVGADGSAVTVGANVADGFLDLATASFRAHKLDPSGAERWVRTLDPGFALGGEAVAIAPDGAVAIGFNGFGPDGVAGLALVGLFEP